MNTLMTKFITLLLTTLLLGLHTAVQAETITFIHNDVLGSPVAATDQAGNVIWREHYNPYGDNRVDDPAATNRDVWYTGKPYNPSTGLSYFGARYYDPTLGRFTGLDPVAFDGTSIHTFNRYGYANNNPYKYVDPDGNLPIIVLIPIIAKAIDIGITAYDTYTAYQEGGADAAAEEIAISAALSIVPGAKIAKKSFDGVKAAKTAAKGTIDDTANYAQKTYGESFSDYGKFAGQTIDDVAAQLRKGDLTTADVPIEFFTRKGGQTVIANTRSAQALTRADIPRSQWQGVNLSGDAAGLRRLAGQLQRNKLPGTGTPKTRSSGLGN